MNEGVEQPDAGMLGCDREVFAQVWSRVSPGGGGPVEVAPAAEKSPADEAPAAERPGPAGGLVCFAGGETGGRDLQELMEVCVHDGAAYRDLTKKVRQRHREQSQRDLAELAQKKARQLRRLSAAYFLMTGVRYTPQTPALPEPGEPFFAALRERFLAEQRLRARLEELAHRAGDPCTGELYRALAEETLETVHTIRLIVERES